MQAFAASEKGIHLKNGDSFLIDEEKGIFAVADGVTIAQGDSSISSSEVVGYIKNNFQGNLAKVIIGAHEHVKGMPDSGSTTLTAAYVSGDVLTVGHIGDSALFLVGSKVRKITSEDAKKGSNLISQAVGVGTIEPHIMKEKLSEGDVILIMTDGVHRYLEVTDILKAVKLPLKEVPEKLIQAAKGKKKLYEDDKTVLAIGL